MRCSRATHFLQYYIDKQLPLEKMRALEVHIADCPDCRRELVLLETLDYTLNSIESVTEPPDLTANIMRRVALTTKRAADRTENRKKEASFVLFRLSLPELVAVVVLATTTTFGIFMQQSALRSLLPFAHEHTGISLVLTTIGSILLSVNINTLMLVFWIFGTILGIWITLLLAGSEMRTLWLKAMMDRLPVW